MLNKMERAKIRMELLEKMYDAVVDADKYYNHSYDYEEREYKKELMDGRVEHHAIYMELLKEFENKML